GWEEPARPICSPRSSEGGSLSSLAEGSGGEFSQLCLDAGVGRLGFVEGGNYYCGQPSLPPRLPLTLYSVAPSLFAKIASRNTQQLFIGVSGSSGTPQAPYQSRFVRSAGLAASFAAELDVLTRQTQARATALAATNRSSYNRSRNLLIAAGAGSLLLALALALLLSDSLLVPLQKTQRRLATIAAGDFSGHLEVPNRDEIGALAAD